MQTGAFCSSGKNTQIYQEQDRRDANNPDSEGNILPTTQSPTMTCCLQWVSLTRLKGPAPEEKSSYSIYSGSKPLSEYVH